AAAAGSTPSCSVQTGEKSCPSQQPGDAPGLHRCPAYCDQHGRLPDEIHHRASIRSNAGGGTSVLTSFRHCEWGSVGAAVSFGCCGRLFQGVFLCVSVCVLLRSSSR
ncbi:hypothetical protein FQN60_014443, partial [Etheostoma spectabile]